jgi:hypothetical protein
MTHSKGNPIPQILTAVKTLLPMIPGAINKDIATPMLKAGTNRIRAIKAEVLDIVKRGKGEGEKEKKSIFYVCQKSIQ